MTYENQMRSMLLGLALKSPVNFVGTSSIIIGVRVEVLNPNSGEVKHTNSCYFTMVAIDELG